MIGLSLLVWGASATAGTGAVSSSSTAAVPTGERIIRASAADLFSIAENLKLGGHAEEAEQLLGLLAHDPNPDVRNEARYRRSKLLVARGRNRDAALLLRRILDDKPNAAPVRLELARLLDRMGDKEAALREVRAVQAAGLPPAVARIVDRYSEALRAARPAGASFEIAIAPDSNMSRATRSDKLGTIFGDFDIGEDSKAKSGIGLVLQGQAFRRFAIVGDDSLLVRATGSADLYKKTQFNDIAFDFAAGPELQWGRSRVSLEAGVTQRWYGQKPFQRSARIGATWVRPLGSRTQLRVEGSAALVDNRVNKLQDGKAFWGQVGVERALSPTTGVGFRLSANRESLRDPGYSTASWQAALFGWREIGRATLTVEARYGRLRADERLALFPYKRSETCEKLTIGTTFRRLTFGGFAPVTRFTIERNRSTIQFYDYRRARTELGIVRAF